MSEIDEGGFLTKGSRIETIKEHPFEIEIFHPGITRRDWLAGLAMQGLLSNPFIMERVYKQLEENTHESAADVWKISGQVHKSSYHHADKMIAQSKVDK